MNAPLSFDSLLYGLYGCCADPTKWKLVLDQLCAETGAGSAVLQYIEIDRTESYQLWNVSDSHFDMEAYREKISDGRNPRLEAARLLAAAKRQSLQGDDELFKSEERPIRDRLQAQLLQLGHGRFIGGLSELGNDRYVALAMHRRAGGTDDFSPRQRDRLHELLPHFAQAVAISQSLACNRSATALVQGHLDRWPSALVVCTPRGQIQWTNKAARAKLAAGGELQLCNQCLQALDSAENRRLTSALHQASEKSEPSFAVFDAANGRLHMAIQLLEAQESGLEPLLLVSITDEEPSGHVSVPALKALFDLTEAEACLASAVVSGVTVAEYALRRGVTTGTARYQLNQVLMKTGAHRQADLVRRVLCSAAGYIAIGRHGGQDAPRR